MEAVSFPLETFEAGDMLSRLLETFDLESRLMVAMEAIVSRLGSFFNRADNPEREAVSSPEGFLSSLNVSPKAPMRLDAALESASLKSAVLCRRALLVFLAGESKDLGFGILLGDLEESRDGVKVLRELGVNRNPVADAVDFTLLGGDENSSLGLTVKEASATGAATEAGVSTLGDGCDASNSMDIGTPGVSVADGDFLASTGPCFSATETLAEVGLLALATCFAGEKRDNVDPVDERREIL